MNTRFTCERQLTDWREQVTIWRDLRGLLYSHSDIVCILIQSNCIELQPSINVLIWVAWIYHLYLYVPKQVTSEECFLNFERRAKLTLPVNVCIFSSKRYLNLPTDFNQTVSISRHSFSVYSDRIRAGRPGLRFPAEAEFSLRHNVKTAAHPKYFPMGTKGGQASVPVGKAAEAWSWPLTFI
jgi:hypothetical protein